MALVLNDRVRETTTTTGTGAVALGGAVSGFETFAAGIGNSNTVYYAIVHRTAAEFEVGLGTLDGDSSDLTRTTVISSSNSDSAVNFASGTKDVFCTLPASKTVFEDADNHVTLPHDLFIQGGLIDLKNDGGAVSQIKFYCESSNAHAQTLIGAPHSESASNTLTLPSTGGDAKLVSATSTATLTNKSIDSDNNTITNIVNADIKSSAAIADSKLATISTAGKVDIGALEIDGATEMSADLADADLFIVDDGAGGTEKSMLASRIPTYVFSKVSGDATVASNGALTIAAQAVENSMLADDAVGADELAANAVVTASIVDDNVTQAKIADDAVGADQLAASAVVTASIVDDAITEAKIADNAVESEHINDNVISGQSALTSGLATTDELLISDGGTIKKMDVSVITEVTDDSATALAIALG
jgi:hypothetical protein